MVKHLDPPPVAYTLLPAQEQFLHILNDCPEPPDLVVDLYQGGVGSGKTWVGALRGLLLAQKFPGSLGLVTALTLPMLKQTTMRKYAELLGKLGFKEGRDYKFNKSESQYTFHCFGGSQVLFRPLDDSEKLKSLTLTWCHLEEGSLVNEADYLLLNTRIRESAVNYLFITTNPEYRSGWLSKQFGYKRLGFQVEELENPTTGEKTKVRILRRKVIAPTSQNINLPPSYLLNLQQTLDPELAKILIEGLDADYAAGQVVKGWSFVNEDEACVYDPDKVIYLSCDFNVDPMCWAVAHRVVRDDGKNEYQFFDELCVPNTTTLEAAEEFARRYVGHEAGIVITGDASGDNRSTQAYSPNETNYTIIRNVLSARGFRNIQPDIPVINPPVMASIQTWNALVCNQFGDRRIKAHPTKCKWLIWNMENMKYVEGAKEMGKIWEPTSNDIKKDMTNTLKYTKHIFDAARYLTSRYDSIKLTDAEVKRGSNVKNFTFQPTRSIRHFG